MLPTHRGAVLSELEGRRDHDPADHHDEGGREPRREEAQRQQHSQRAEPDRQRGRARVTELAEHLDELRNRVDRLDVEPQQLAQLADDEDRGDAVDVADEHWAREIVGEPRESQQPRQHEARGDQQRERRGEARGFLRAGRGEPQHRRADERGDRPLRPDNELAGGAQQRVHDRRQEQRVQPVDR
jgi:hypothetical protein